MNALVEALKAATADLEGMSNTKRECRMIEIGKIVAGFIPHGYSVAFLSGMRDKERESGGDHVAEALDEAIDNILHVENPSQFYELEDPDAEELKDPNAGNPSPLEGP